MRTQPSHLSPEAVNRARSLFHVIGNPEQAHRTRCQQDEQTPGGVAAFIRGEVKALITGPEDLEAELYRTRPLALAVLSRNFTGAEVLLELGADPNAEPTCDPGGSMLSLALRIRDVDMMTLLARYGATLSSDTMLQIVRERWVEELEFLRLGGISLDTPTEIGDTMLTYAINMGATPVVNGLLVQGADPDVRNTDLQAPLHLAVDKLQPEIVRVLIRHGADLTARDPDGRTPKELVTHRRNHSNPNQIKTEVFDELDAALRTEELKRVAEQAQAGRQSAGKPSPDSFDSARQDAEKDLLEQESNDELDTALGL